MRRNLTFALAALLIGLVSSSAAAQDTVDTHKDHRADQPVEVGDSHRDRITFLLSGYDYFPSYADLIKVTPNAGAVLFDIANDSDAKMSHRIRAIDALGLFPQSDGLATFFENRLAKLDDDPIQMNHVINASLKVYRELALPWVSPHMNHTDLQTRLTAIHAIGLFGGLEGKQMLQFHLQFAQDNLVRETFDKALTR